MRIELVREGFVGDGAQLICLVAAPEEPLDRLPELESSLVVVSVDSWGRDLTPWPAPAAYPNQPPYEGRAAETLDELLREVLPRAEREAGLAPVSRAIAGYSLAGLFALWAFASTDAFGACASGSGSLWYPGWLDWLSDQRFVGEGRRAYLSLGSKESRVRHPLVAGVADATARTVELLEARGVACTFESNPGGHFTDISGRLAKALRVLDYAPARCLPSQLDEMRAENLTLVVPKALHKAYPKGGDIITLAEFIEVVHGANGL